MASRSRMLLAAAALTSVAFAAACGSSGGGSSSSAPPSASSAKPAALPSGPASSSESLSETGSTLLYPLFNIWGPAYTKQYSQVKITTAGTGSGTGISQAAAGAVDIGASDAYLSPGQRSAHPGLLNVPLAISAQQINYNLPGFSGTLKLNGKVLSAIYQGKITTWNNPQIAAINPGAKLPNMKIVPVHRSDGSGDTFIFTQYLSKQDPSGWGNSIAYGTTVTWPKVAGEVAAQGNGGMVTACKQNPGCIAYIGVSYLSKTQAAGVGEAAIANASGNYLQPTASTVSAGAAGFASQTPANGSISMINGPAAQGYPIINYEYAILNSKQSSAAAAQDVKAFLNWSLTTGNSAMYLDQVKFQPLPSSVVKQSQAQLAQLSG